MGLAAAAFPLGALAGSTPAAAAAPAAPAPAAATASPPGANNWSCRPSAAHPDPVVLVHGTFSNQRKAWSTLSPLLAGRGYCVFALTYGAAAGSSVGGVKSIESSAAQLAAFINRVLAATGARQVDIVGHSQGGMMPRYYLKFLDGAPKVHRLIGLAPSNHGTTLDGVVTLFQLAGLRAPAAALVGTVCPACAEQLVGSAFLAKLNAGGDTVAGVVYTVIETRDDRVVTPFTSAFLRGPDVTNLTLQDRCPADRATHSTIVSDPAADADVLNALDPASRVRVACPS